MEILQEAPDNIWSASLVQLLKNWQVETSDTQNSKQLLLEYLYESLAEQRRSCRLGSGIFLSTVHSVKGMEFSHVFILDGGWDAPATEEQRRLYYVAMTRAQETLCLLHRQDLQNPYLPALSGDFLLTRENNAGLTEAVSAENKHYSILGLHDFDLGYAGSFAEQHPIHRVLANMHVGSHAEILCQNGKVVVLVENVVVSVLSKKVQQQWNNQLKNIKSAEVIAMITRYKTDSEDQYQSRYKVEQWEVPMLEVVL